MKRALALGTAAAAGVAYFHAQWPTSQVYGATICRGSSDRRRIALTYDDGPNPAYTPALLELLERNGAKATFFSIGQWAEREPGLLREVHAAGHAIGNHTYTHPTMPLLSSAAVADEMARCRAAVEAAGIEFTRVGDEMLMRPPYGRRRPGTLKAVRADGYV
ncbi:MAG: polysaccharide deacetylase family protein, partial [Thermoleophilaceae bacterium]